MSKVSQIPVPWPGPDFTVTFRPSMLKTLLLFSVTLGFVVLGTMAGVSKGDVAVIVGVVFFAVCALVFVVQLHPRACYLTLKSDGFICCSLFRKFEVKWDDVQGFYDRSFSHDNMVVFDYIPEFSSHATGRRWSKHLAGCEGALPDTYGFKASELAGILNQLRDQHLASRPSAVAP